MKSSSLKSLLNGSGNTEDFLLSVEEELDIFQTALNKQGSTVPIQLDEDTKI